MFPSEVTPESPETRDSYWRTAFARNIGLLSLAEQRVLAGQRVAIPGLGGVGGIHLLTLARTGIGSFHLADYDTFEPANLNRQAGAFLSTVGRSKLDVMRALAADINPHLELKGFSSGVTESNVDEFLSGVHLVIDGLDFFEIKLRRRLFARAWELGIPVITAGPIGFGCSMLIFIPGMGMSFDRYFDFQLDESEESQYRRFAIGLTPNIELLRYFDRSKIDFTAKRGPSLALACDLCAGMAATEALRILLQRGSPLPAPHYMRLDPYLRRYHQGYLRGGNRNLLQRLKLKLLPRAILPPDKRSMPVLPKPEAGPLTEGDIRFLVHAAAQAPSGDNSQPWRFSWDGADLRIFNAPERGIAFYSANGEADFIALGAAVENIRIAATHIGRRAVVSILGSLDGHSPLATIRFEDTACSPDPLLPFIYERSVNRLQYRRQPLNRSVIDELNRAVGPSIKNLVHWIVEPEELRRLAKVAYRADKILWEHQRLHQDLMRWIRWDGRNTNDGMPQSVLGMNPFERLMFPLLRYWPLVRLAGPFGFSSVVAMKSYRWMLNCGAHCLITIPDTQAKSYITGAMVMERFWTAAASLGLSVQPMSGSIMLAGHLRQARPAFSDRHVKVIREIAAELEDLLKHSSAKVPLMLFRVGYAKEPRARTGRLPLSEIFSVQLTSEK